MARIQAAFRTILWMIPWSIVTLLLGSQGSGAQDRESPEYALAIRRQAVLQYFAEGAGTPLKGADSGPPPEMGVVAARFAALEKLADTYKIYAAQLRHPRHDLGYNFSLIAAYLHGQKFLPDSLKAAVQRHFVVYPMFRGRSELDWHLYYSTILLAAQAWPQAAAHEWFNGKSSAENYREANEYLLQWMERVATQGQSEFDSPEYLPAFLAPLFVLYDFAEEAQLRHRARMIIDLLLADFAVEHLAGQYAGGHSRIPASVNLLPSRSRTAGLAWLLFGAGEMTASGDLLLVALSSYQVPEVVLGMGINRNETYVHRERKAHAALYRQFLGGDNAEAVNKYTYVTRDYAVGSLTGVVSQPQEQQTWAVSYVDADDRHPLFFATHPYAGSAALGMFFPDPPRVLAKTLATQDANFARPEKLHGASPFEKIFQHRNVLMALYDIPAHVPNPRVNGFLSKDISIRERNDNGWILCQAGRTFLAVKFLRPVEWQEIPEGWRLVSLGRRNAIIVEVSSFDDFRSFEEFKSRLAETKVESRQISAASKLIYTNPYGEAFDVASTGDLITGIAKLTYTSSYGDVLEISSAGERKLNGYPVPSGRWPLFDGPFIKADERQRTVLLRNDKIWRQLNFAKWEIRDIDGSFGADLTRHR